MLRKFAWRVLCLGLTIMGGASVRADGEMEIYVDGTKLIIIGDNKPNGLAIHSYQPGEITITSESTSLNGEKKLAFSKIEDVSIDLYNGKDVLEFYGHDVYANIAGTLIVNMGGDDDFVSFEEFHVGGQAWIYLDDRNQPKFPGDDVMLAHQLNVYGLLNVQAGPGSDDVSFDVDGTAFDYNMALDGARLDLGEDKSGDNLSIASLFSWGSIEVLGSDGDDSLDLSDVAAYNGDVKVTLGDGTDELAISDSFMDWQQTQVATSIIVKTAGPMNTVEFDNVEVRGSVIVKGNTGRDGADFHRVFAREQLVFDGAGQDDMLFVRFSESASHDFQGGSGDGDLIWQVNSSVGAGSVSGFELE